MFETFEEMMRKRDFEVMATCLGSSALRPQVVAALIEMKDPQCIAPLLGAIKKWCSEETATAMAEVLREFNDPQVVHGVGALLNDTRSGVRERAATVLGELRDSQAVEPLCETLLHDKEKEVRFSCVVALGKLGDPRAVDPLIVALKDQKPDIRAHAALALGKLKDTRAVEPLKAMLNDTPYVKEIVGLALDELGRSREVWALVRDAEKHINEPVLAAGQFFHHVRLGCFGGFLETLFGLVFSVIFGILGAAAMGPFGTVVALVFGFALGYAAAVRLLRKPGDLPAEVILAVTPSRVYVFSWKFTPVATWERSCLRATKEIRLNAPTRMKIEVMDHAKVGELEPVADPNSPGASLKVIKLLCVD